MRKRNVSLAVVIGVIQWILSIAIVLWIIVSDSGPDTSSFELGVDGRQVKRAAGWMQSSSVLG